MSSDFLYVRWDLWFAKGRLEPFFALSRESVDRGTRCRVVDGELGG